jgi:hypothetical protein
MVDAVAAADLRVAGDDVVSADGGAAADLTSPSMTV